MVPVTVYASFRVVGAFVLEQSPRISPMIVYFCSVYLYVQVWDSLCIVIVFCLCKAVFSVCVGHVVCHCLVNGLVLLLCLF